MSDFHKNGFVIFYADVGETRIDLETHVILSSVSIDGIVNRPCELKVYVSSILAAMMPSLANKIEVHSTNKKITMVDPVIHKRAIELDDGVYFVVTIESSTMIVGDLNDDKERSDDMPYLAYPDGTVFLFENGRTGYMSDGRLHMTDNGDMPMPEEFDTVINVSYEMASYAYAKMAERSVKANLSHDDECRIISVKVECDGVIVEVPLSRILCAFQELDMFIPLSGVDTYLKTGKYNE